MTKDEAKALFSGIQANQKRLDDCEGPHIFIDNSSDKREMWKRKKCEKCGGTTDAIHAHWYNKGLDHGRKEK